MDDAKFAKLLGKGVWQVYPKRMLQMRARSQNLKDNFPDVLMGSAIAEYDLNIDPSSEQNIEGHEIKTDKAAMLKDMLKEQKSEAKVIESEVVQPREIEIPLEQPTLELCQ
jgi:hypothetical protein